MTKRYGYPVSYAQERLWFLDQLAPGQATYNMPAAVELSGRLDEGALRRSLAEIVRRHEALRTTIVTVEGQPLQVIAPQLSLTLSVADLSALEAEGQMQEVERLVTVEALRPFDLAQGPLFRVGLLRLGAERHVLLFNVHHIVFDEWSAGVFLHELGALYEAFAAGKPSPLAELPIQYVDFALWQREWLQGETLAALLAYWREQLEGAPAMLELPTDRPRPAVQRFVGGEERLGLAAGLATRLRELSRRAGTTLFMVLVAAFKALLHRYTGQQDVVIGLFIANRNRSEIEGLIGFFVNTLVMRTAVSGDETCEALLERVREVTLGAYGHQDLPFEKLVEELRPERNLSHNPLFQVVFVLQNAPVDELRLPGLTLRPLAIERGTARFDLTLNVWEAGAELDGVLEYNSDLYDAATVRRMIGHYAVLLAGIVADPARRVANLPLLTEGERHELLRLWNETQVAYEEEACLHELFAAQAAQVPDTVAVADGMQTVTYGALEERANRLAHHLRELGVALETLVGVYSERTVEMVVGLLGILKAGGAYLPLDPTYPAERLAFMLTDAGAGVLLTQERYAAELAAIGGQGVRLVCLDGEGGALAGWPTTTPQRVAGVDNLAYVIYTSGSTGRPKGVQILHRAVVNFLEAMRRRVGLNGHDVLLSVTTLSFDISVLELFLPLAVGGRVELAGRALAMDGLALPARLAACGATVMQATPTTWRLLLGAGWQGERRLRLLCGGEALPRALADELLVRGASVWNLYGPTETTVWSAVWQVEAGGTVRIGRPIGNTQLYVLDERGQPAPLGVPGVLYIDGAGLARGYLGQPELTAERFVPDPLGGQAGGRLYDTGDLVRYRPDGNLEFLGRMDHQVKVRGYRIELGEVETALEGHPATDKAVVVAREDEPGDRRLVAYVVARDGVALPAGELRAHVRQSLPEYMVPAWFMVLERLPLTPSGKVDRRALPAPEGSRPALEAAFVAPRTPAEETLAGIWAEVLRLDAVGVHDDFFELGGDSIISIRVIAKANQAGLALTPMQLFLHRTVAELVAAAGETLASGAEQGLVTGDVPLTPIQHWFFEQVTVAPHHWNQALLLQTRQPLALERLAEALRRLLAHHDALRLRFERWDGGWQQRIAGLDGALPLIAVALSALPEPQQTAAVETAAAQAQASLNLSAGPLLRIIWFDLGPGRPGRLLVVVHHLAVDGLSWRILLQDLWALYTQLGQGEAPQLPPKTTSFKQWAEQLIAHTRSDRLRQELTGWLAKPRRAAPLLPLDYASGENTVASARMASAILTTDETRALLQEVPQTYRTTIEDVLLTALLQTFARWTEERTLLVALERHGRQVVGKKELDVSRTVGWFTTLTPLCLDLGDGQDVGEALKSVKEQLRRVPGNGLAYGLWRYLVPDGELAVRLRALAQPQVVFNYLGQWDELSSSVLPLDIAPEAAGPTADPQGKRPYLLEINAWVVASRLQVDWRYSQNIHRAATVERLADEFGQALRALIAHCQSPQAGGYTPSDFPAAGISQAELDSLLAQLGQTEEK